MGAAASVSNDEDKTCSQKAATSLKSPDCNKTTAMTVCSGCKTPLSIFTRKPLICDVCGTVQKCTGCTQLHCSRCLVARTGFFSSRPACAKCMTLVMGDYTHDYLARQFTVRELRQFLSGRQIPVDGCTEKHDLIALVMQLRHSSAARAEEEEHSRHLTQLRENMCRELQSDIVSSVNRSSSGVAEEQPASPLQHGSPSTASMAMTSDAVPAAAETHMVDNAVIDEPSSINNESSALRRDPESASGVLHDSSEVSGNTTAEVSTPCDDADSDNVQQLLKDVMRHRIGLTDIVSRDDIDVLTVRQLKDLLVNNYVDYRGCCEKQELVERVNELWTDHRKQNPAADTDVSEVRSDDLCKVCMDAVVNCILLECGHMVSCTDCGKRLAECPICRRYVSRVVHVFRA